MGRKHAFRTRGHCEDDAVTSPLQPVPYYIIVVQCALFVPRIFEIMSFSVAVRFEDAIDVSAIRITFEGFDRRRIDYVGRRGVLVTHSKRARKLKKRVAIQPGEILSLTFTSSSIQTSPTSNDRYRYRIKKGKTMVEYIEKLSILTTIGPKDITDIVENSRTHKITKLWES